MSNELRDEAALDRYPIGIVSSDLYHDKRIGFKAGWDACEKHYKAEIEKIPEFHWRDVFEKNVVLEKELKKQSEIIKVLKEALRDISLIKFSGACVYSGAEDMNFIARQALAKVQEMEGG